MKGIACNKKMMVDDRDTRSLLKMTFLSFFIWASVNRRFSISRFKHLFEASFQGKIPQHNLTLWKMWLTAFSGKAPYATCHSPCRHTTHSLVKSGIGSKTFKTTRTLILYSGSYGRYLCMSIFVEAGHKKFDLWNSSRHWKMLWNNE